MSATTTEGTGPGAVERYIPRKLYAQQIIRADNILGLEQIVREVPPKNIDGGELKMMMLNLSDEEMKTILKAAEILKNLPSFSGNNY